MGCQNFVNVLIDPFFKYTFYLKFLGLKICEQRIISHPEMGISNEKNSGCERLHWDIKGLDDKG